MARFNPTPDPNHPSLALRPDLKGSYFRRIADIGHAVRKLELGQSNNQALGFIGYYFACEKLAKGAIGIHFRYPVLHAYHHRLYFSLSDLMLARAALNLSISGDDLIYLFADRPDLPDLHAIAATPHYTSARILRNNIGHDLGPTHVGQVLKHAGFFNSKMLALLACEQQVLTYLKAHFSHIA